MLELRIGFDVVNIRLAEENGKLFARTGTISLTGSGGHSIFCVSGGKLYIVEYCRQNETVGSGSEGFVSWIFFGRLLG